jgi:hypothetical protein
VPPEPGKAADASTLTKYDPADVPLGTHVLRVPCSFRLTLPGGLTLTCQQAAARLGRRGWDIRSAGTGTEGQR